ncbi:MAG: hypothetical protein ACP6IP_06895 [Candidatus Njordarchaeia archaeon]
MLFVLWRGFKFALLSGILLYLVVVSSLVVGLFSSRIGNSVSYSSLSRGCSLDHCEFSSFNFGSVYLSVKVYPEGTFYNYADLSVFNNSLFDIGLVRGLLFLSFEFNKSDNFFDPKIGYFKSKDFDAVFYFSGESISYKDAEAYVGQIMKNLNVSSFTMSNPVSEFETNRFYIYVYASVNSTRYLHLALSKLNSSFSNLIDYINNFWSAHNYSFFTISTDLESWSLGLGAYSPYLLKNKESNVINIDIFGLYNALFASSSLDNVGVTLYIKVMGKDLVIYSAPGYLALQYVNSYVIDAAYLRYNGSISELLSNINSEGSNISLTMDIGFHPEIIIKKVSNK